MEPSKPNIILINCDDLGYGDLHCYGSPCNETPNIDHLASEGIKFTDFYMASSVCSPSRAGMLTGCYPQRLSINRVLFPGEATGLNPAEKTIAGMLKEQGYATGLVGKWHCGDQREFLPDRHGFDFYFGLPYSNDMGCQKGNTANYPPLPLLRDGEVVEQQPDQSLLTGRYVEESIKFIRKNVNAGQPFFLYLAHMYVHVPLFVPERFVNSSRNGRYGGAVACIDWAWGELDQELKNLGIAENTLVIFTSDNGSRAADDGNNQGRGSNAPLRGTKFTTYEGGFRLPCLMRWPGKIPAGKVIHEMASSLDFLPSLAALTGGKLPAKAIDGVDISELITGKNKHSPRDTFFYMSMGNICAVRKGKWKLHRCRRDRHSPDFAAVKELFNLEEDCAECVNLYEGYPEVVEQLSALIDEAGNLYGDIFTSRSGSGVRPCGRVENPRPLSAASPDIPCVIAEYDLDERG